MAIPDQIPRFRPTWAITPRACAYERTVDGLQRGPHSKYVTGQPEQSLGKHMAHPLSCVVAPSYHHGHRPSTSGRPHYVTDTEGNTAVAGDTNHIRPPTEDEPPPVYAAVLLARSPAMDNVIGQDTSYTPKPLDSLDPTLEWTVQHAHLFHPVAEFRNRLWTKITTWSSTCKMRPHPGWARCHRTFNTPTQQPNKPPRCRYSHTCYNRYNTHKPTSHMENYRQGSGSGDNYNPGPTGTFGPIRSTSTQRMRTSSSSTTKTTYRKSYNKRESTTATC